MERTAPAALLLMLLGQAQAVRVALEGGGGITIAVATASSFRLGVDLSQGEDVNAVRDGAAIASPMIDPTTAPAASTPCGWSGFTGLCTSFGALLVSPGGAFALYDDRNRTILASVGPPKLAEGGVSLSLTSPTSDLQGSPGLPCLSNGMFGPPFAWDSDGKFFAFAVTARDHDDRSPPNKYVHCYPTTFDGDPGGTDSQGYQWWVLGDRADWYLAPVESGYEFSTAYSSLTGAAALPPRWAFGFMATYWGFNNMEEVVGNMTLFRDGRFPIDSLIMDYDWWRCGTSPGDNCTHSKNGTGQDFGYDAKMFGPHTFHTDSHSHSGMPRNGGGWPEVHTTGAQDLFSYFHTGLGEEEEHTLRFRFGGIRKPRAYSSVQLSNDSGWLLPDADSVGAGDNNWNYTVESFRNWYTKGHLHFLNDGIDFWWNDEGETQWFTYHFWNLAQKAEWAEARPGQRLFTLNRAFTPGMQRFPAVTWTGDDQDCTHTTALKFAQWGQPYFTCDLTSPSATVLLRQYQGAVWWPIMRVHQMHGPPRFPWYWGGQEHQDAFRAALQTRYAIIPLLYSLAHAQHRLPYPPMVHPASFDFDELGQPDLSKTYMIGRSFIAADLSVAKSPDPNENRSTVVLPGGVGWYVFNSSECVMGGQTVVRDDLALDEFPVYVRAGSVAPLHPWDRVVQHSQAQGGLLELQVYAGRDATFTMFEDDGLTDRYMSTSSSSSTTRTTVWEWDESAKTVSWVASGPAAFAGGNDYTHVRVALYACDEHVQRSATVPIGASGTVHMGRRVAADGSAQRRHSQAMDGPPPRSLVPVPVPGDGVEV